MWFANMWTGGGVKDTGKQERGTMRKKERERK